MCQSTKLQTHPAILHCKPHFCFASSWLGSFNKGLGRDCRARGGRRHCFLLASCLFLFCRCHPSCFFMVEVAVGTFQKQQLNPVCSYSDTWRTSLVFFSSEAPAPAQHPLIEGPLLPASTFYHHPRSGSCFLHLLLFFHPSSYLVYRSISALSFVFCRKNNLSLGFFVKNLSHPKAETWKILYTPLCIKRSYILPDRRHSGNLV